MCVCVNFITRHRKIRSTWIPKPLRWRDLRNVSWSMAIFFALSVPAFPVLIRSTDRWRPTLPPPPALANSDKFERFLADVHLVHLGGFKMPSSSKIQCKYPCPKCSSIFSRKNNLYSHMKFECGQLPRFGCPYCGYASKKSSNIRAHIRRKHYGYKVDVIPL